MQLVACYPLGLCWHGLVLRELGSSAQFVWCAQGPPSQLPDLFPATQVCFINPWQDVAFLAIATWRFSNSVFI